MEPILKMKEQEEIKTIFMMQEEELEKNYGDLFDGDEFEEAFEDEFEDEFADEDEDEGCATAVYLQELMKKSKQ